MTEPTVDIPFEVREHEHGSRVDLFLSRRVTRMSRSLAARVVRHGKVRREPGGEVFDKPSARVFEGDTVIMRRRPLNEGPTDHIRVPIVYEDAHLLAVSKPGHLVVHPTASAYHRTLIRIMRSRTGDAGLDLAHRIDKETSGLIVMTRNARAANRLAKQFAGRTVDKSYLALVVGCPSTDTISVDVPLRLVPDSLTRCLMQVGGEGAQPASTAVRVLARSERAALVEARPKTGRQHQIRVHLAHLGHPILGDKLYLGSEAFFIEAIRADYPREAVVGAVGHHRQALHAWRTRFVHPDTEAPLELAAPLPADLAELAGRLGIDVSGVPGLEVEAEAPTAPSAPRPEDPPFGPAGFGVRA